METIFIKNMVCSRCIMVVNQILSKLKLTYSQVYLGSIAFDKSLSDEAFLSLKIELEKVGFEILTKEEDRIIENIKRLLRNQVNNIDGLQELSLSEFISNELPKNYHHLSKLFSASQGKTIERYFIELKIEKVMELIKYNKLSISEISYALGYSSPQHLSRQFKHITGMTTSEFKKQGNRTKLDTI